MLKSCSVVLCVLALVLWGAQFAAATLPAYYGVTDLGTLPGDGQTTAFSYGMSSSGNWVAGVGFYFPAGNPLTFWWQGFAYNNGAMHALPPTPDNPTVPLTTGWSNTLSNGYLQQTWGVNNVGTVAGQFNSAAFYYKQGDAGPTMIPGLPANSIALAITNPTASASQGLVVGDWQGDWNSGFTYNIATSQLTHITAGSFYSVNDNGQMTGGNGVGLYRDASGTVYSYPALNWGQAIDSSGKYIAGVALDNSSVVLDITNPNSPATTTIPGVSGQPWGVNRNGLVVGGDNFSYTASKAWIYDGSVHLLNDLNYVNLPSSGVNFVTAMGITDSGRILTWGIAADGQPHSFLLTPTLLGDANLDGKVDINDLSVVLTNYDKTAGVAWGSGDFNHDGKVDINDLSIVLTNYDKTAGASAAAIAAVPEPGTLALFALAAAGLAAFAWRKRR